LPERIETEAAFPADQLRSVRAVALGNTLRRTQSVKLIVSSDPREELKFVIPGSELQASHVGVRENLTRGNVPVARRWAAMLKASTRRWTRLPSTIHSGLSKRPTKTRRWHGRVIFCAQQGPRFLQGAH
jgi:hypothetical protein